MAKKYEKQNNVGLRILCAVLALILIAACTLGGLELWGTDKMKPSNWGKDDLAPVTISFSDGLKNSTRVYSLTAVSDKFPSTKRATATCALPEGGSPDSYEWELTGGEGLSMRTVASDGSIAEITARQYFNGSATLTARAYKNGELRGIGSISIYAREPEPEPEPLPALSLLLLSLQSQSSKYQHDLETFKNEVLSETAEEVDLQEITMDTNSDSITENIEKATEYEADLIVIFDNYGTIVNGITSFDPLSDSGLPFVVIDDEAYAAEEVEAAGGYYLTADFYDAGDARATLDGWNTYGQEIALKYHTPGASETAFDAFIDELFDHSMQEFGEDQLGDLYQKYAFEYDVTVCVPNGAMLSNVIQSLRACGDDAPGYVTWIINDYYCEEGYDPQEEIYAEYPDLGNAIVYQRQLNGRGIIKAIIGLLVNGEEIGDHFAYERVRVL